MEKKTTDVKGASKYIGVSKDLIYELVRTNQIPHIRLGRRILFDKVAIDKWLEQKMEGGLNE